jgi:hypothetical protein
MPFLPLGIPRPFQKESVDNYPGVLVPLAHARRHHTVEAEYARRYSQEGEAAAPEASDSKKGASEDGKEAENVRDVEASRLRGVWDRTYTIEGLREEVNEDVAASGHDSSYDCKSCASSPKHGRSSGWGGGEEGRECTNSWISEE